MGDRLGAYRQRRQTVRDAFRGVRKMTIVCESSVCQQKKMSTMFELRPGVQKACRSAESGQRPERTDSISSHSANGFQFKKGFFKELKQAVQSGQNSARSIRLIDHAESTLNWSTKQRGKRLFELVRERERERERERKRASWLGLARELLIRNQPC